MSKERSALERVWVRCRTRGGDEGTTAPGLGCQDRPIASVPPHRPAMPTHCNGVQLSGCHVVCPLRLWFAQSVKYS
jgi:hypothetical protein